MLCYCMGYSHEEVEQELQEKNYPTLDEFRQDTFVGMGCGRCLPVLDEIFEKVNKKN